MQPPPYRVLVVDDAPQNLLVAEAFLEPLQCCVTTARTGLECLASVEAEPPDLILLDVVMPQMDGLTACRALKHNRDYRHIPVVLLSSLDSTEDRVAGIEAGADDFVSKPFNRHELLARVKSLIRVKRLVERERSHLRSTLERYVDAAVAQQLIDCEELAVPGGTRVDASVLFADVREFSGWSERMEPEVVVEVMNAFLGRAVEAVFKHGGAVDKFTGDGLMAIFGAPVSLPDHARSATAAGLEIAGTACSIVHPSLHNALLVGCGVNSGQMIVGNIGSERRLDYTAMGDAVNVARRLCDEAAGGQVLVTDTTHARLEGCLAEDMGVLQVKHRREPVRAYAVTSLGPGNKETTERPRLPLSHCGGRGAVAARVRANPTGRRYGAGGQTRKQGNPGTQQVRHRVDS